MHALFDGKKLAIVSVSHEKMPCPRDSIDLDNSSSLDHLLVSKCWVQHRQLAEAGNGSIREAQSGNSVDGAKEIANRSIKIDSLLYCAKQIVNGSFNLIKS